jgi:5-methylcytosine-specific restriction endonuclease McrA
MAKLAKTSTPGIFRRHVRGCDGQGRCECSYVVNFQKGPRGERVQEEFRTWAEAREAVRDARTRMAKIGVGQWVPVQVVSPQRRSLSAKVRQYILDRDGPHCRICGSGDDPQIDHIIPVASGGGDNDDNLQVLCGGCNRTKGSTFPQILEAA